MQVHLKVGDFLKIIVLVFVCDQQVGATNHQFFFLSAPEEVLVDAKAELKCVNVVGKRPLAVAVVVVVHVFQV